MLELSLPAAPGYIRQAGQTHCVMKMRANALRIALLLVLPALGGQAASAPGAGQPAARLKELTEEIGKNPEDVSLRERAVKLALALKPKPTIPEEARRHFVKGNTFQKEATSVSDYALAISAYKEALLLAPWWPEAIYNLAIAQESAGLFEDSIRNFNLYLLTNPKDAESTRNRMYAAEAKKEKAARNAAAAEEEKKRKEEESLKTLTGEWIMADDNPVYTVKKRYELTRQEGSDWFILAFKSCDSSGPTGTEGCTLQGYQERLSFGISGRSIHGPMWGSVEVVQNWNPWHCGSVKQEGNIQSGALSEDGREMNLELKVENFNVTGCAKEGFGIWKYKLRRAD